MNQQPLLLLLSPPTTLPIMHRIVTIDWGRRAWVNVQSCKPPLATCACLVYIIYVLTEGYIDALSATDPCSTAVTYPALTHVTKTCHFPIVAAKNCVRLISLLLKAMLFAEQPAL